MVFLIFIISNQKNAFSSLNVHYARALGTKEIIKKLKMNRPMSMLLSRNAISIPILILSLFFHESKAQEKLIQRFSPPPEYHWAPTIQGSFSQWLGDLKLKPKKSHTHTYFGEIAGSDMFTAAVLEDYNPKNSLQQCADAIIRLRAEYLYNAKKYSSISFHFTNGMNCPYLEFRKGYRFNKGKWILSQGEDLSRKGFDQYLNLVFEYAGTLSLEKELKPYTRNSKIQAGDIFIHGGSPGHAFIILGLIENAAGHPKFLIGQSYIPAQEIQVLEYKGNPWFELGQNPDFPYGELINTKYLRIF